MSFVRSASRILVPALVLLSTAFGVHGKSDAAPLHVRVGVFQNAPLVSYDRATQKARGIFAVVLDHAARQNDWEIEYVPGTFSEQLERLERGELDLLPAMPYTPSRELRGLEFNADPIVTSWGRIFVRPGSKIAAIPDLSGKTVAVLKSSLLSEYVTDTTLRYGTAAHLQEWSTYREAFQAVRDGKADAVLANRFSGALNARAANLHATSVVLAPYGFRIAGRRGSAAVLLPRIDAALEDLKSDAGSDYYTELSDLDDITREYAIPAWMKAVAATSASLLALCSIWVVCARRAARKVQGLAERLAQSEQQHRRARAALQRISDHSLGIIAVLDRDFVIRRINRACTPLLGYTPEELVGKSALTLTPDSSKSLRTFERVAAGTPVHSEEAPLLRRDGSSVRMLWSLVWSEADEELYAIGHDDTERYQLIAQLQVANRDLRTFAQSVSHDLRAPVSAVIGFVGAALQEEGHLLGERSRNRLQRAQRAGVRMDATIVNLLRLARVSEMGIRRRSCDVTALCEDVVASLLANDPERAPEFRIEPGMTAYADRELLHHVFENLLSNACKFTRDTHGAVVTVGCDQDAAEPVFFVRDNGAGFDMAFADRLFTPFTRLHDQTKYEGSGIGLSIVHRVVSGHGGSISAQSAPDMGAEFRFTLGQSDEARTRWEHPNGGASDWATLSLASHAVA